MRSAAAPSRGDTTPAVLSAAATAGALEEPGRMDGATVSAPSQTAPSSTVRSLIQEQLHVLLKAQLRKRAEIVRLQSCVWSQLLLLERDLLCSRQPPPPAPL